MSNDKKTIQPKIFYDDDIKSFLERVSETGYDIVPITKFTVEELYDKLLDEIKYLPEEDHEIIKKAFEKAKKCHEGVLRKSKEPYIVHPLWVGIILAEMELDKESIAAGLLHDVIEDTDTTYDDVKKEFGEEIAELVDGVTKLGQLDYKSGKLDVQADNLRKMFLAMAKDIRVILIKLADRLHNMRTLQYMSREKQIEKSNETMDIYSPIAERLGITKIRIELDDLALLYSHPKEYANLLERVNLRQTGRETFINEIIEDVKKHIKTAHIQAEIYGRVKHLFSIYRKMVNQDKDVDEIYDLFAIRILVENVKDCYGALGVIHDMYKPIPGRFKDYIAMPKNNDYQSLHTTVIGPNGQPFEVQIRTYEMHRIAEFGIAAHWKYKQSGYSAKNIEDNEEAKLTWLREVLEWQQEMSDNQEFLSLLKRDLDLFSDHVYCFTPDGDVKTFPTGSTTVDFAYSIHSAVGNHMIGARVNGKLVPIEYVLQNGDRVSILTSQNSTGPSRDWIKLAKSAQAKNKINHWFKNINKDDDLAKGKELLSNSLKQKGYDPTTILKDKFEKAVKRKYSFNSWDGVLATIGRGGLKEGQVANRLIEEYNKLNKDNTNDEEALDRIVKNKQTISVKKTKGDVIVKGADDIDVHFARCCTPMPGDEIVGFVTRGRGITIHRTDCKNIITLSDDEKDRLITAEWQNILAKDQGRYYTEINVYSKTRKGIVVDLTRIFVEQKIEILSMNVRNAKNDITTVEIGFELDNRSGLNKIIQDIKQIKSVIDVTRKNG